MLKPCLFTTLLAIVLGLVGDAKAKEPLTAGETSDVMKDLDPYLIDAFYGDDAKGQTGRFGAEGGVADLLTEPAFVKLVDQHDLKLFNGPMLGNVKPNSAQFWVRTAGAATVQIHIGELVSQPVTTAAEDDFTAVMTVTGLQPFSEYEYSVDVDGRAIKDKAFRFRTAPKPGQSVAFHVAFGSGARYVPPNEYAWENMAKTRPLAYLGLGDNVDIDVMNRRGAQRLFYYRRCLSPAYRELISGVAHWSF